MSETVTIPGLGNGERFTAYLAKPEGKPKAAIIVIQEIFGVNPGIRRKCDKWAEEGYLAIAPDVFLDGTYQPQSCETGLIQILFGADYAEGRCLPDCLPGVDNFLIGRDGCDPGMKCAPCLDPLTGDSSGACDPLPL